MATTTALSGASLPALPARRGRGPPKEQPRPAHMLGIQRRDFRRHIIGLRCMFMSMCRKFVHVPYSFVHAKCDAMASEAGGKSVSLAYRNLTELPRELAARRHQLESLDLSHNRFSYPQQHINV